MKSMKCLLAAAVVLLAAACGPKKADAPKVLVLYYSQTENTQIVAQTIATALGADLEAILPVVPYDGSYQETIARGMTERQSGVLPEIHPLNANIADYDVIFLGYPIWFGTYAMPIATLVKQQSFAGKKVVPFCTFGSGGLNTSTEALKKALPKAQIQTGYGVRTARVAAAPKEIDRFLKENGYKKGTVKKLPPYSAQKPVTKEEKAIFDAACSNYQFPLGTPSTVGKRTTPDGTDYKFTVKNGAESTIIYVTVGKEAGAKPEFTQVVR